MFVYASACLGNACVVNVLTAIVKRIELNVNALYKCYPLLLLLSFCQSFFRFICKLETYYGEKLNAHFGEKTR